MRDHVCVEDDEEREDNSTADTYGQINHLGLKEHLEERRARQMKLEVGIIIYTYSKLNHLG